jgi:hypothetical protein
MSIEQRRYHTDLKAQILAEYLVATYSIKDDLNTRIIGEGNNILLQIRKGQHVGSGDRVASLAIVSNPDNHSLVVSLGEQEWMNAGEAGTIAVTGLLSMMIAPWVLFALLWPASSVVSRLLLPPDLWRNVEEYVFSQGGSYSSSQFFQHPANQ